MNFSENDIRSWVRKFYRLEVSVTPLNGYDELNFLLQDQNHKKYILKIAGDEHGLHFLDAQIKIVNHLSKSRVAGKFQQYLLNNEGLELTTLVMDGKNFYLRLLTFIEGVFWVDTREKNDELLTGLGRFLGEMDQALLDFSHPAMHRRYTWDISTAPDANAKIPCIKDHERRRIAAYFLMQFEMEVLPQLSSLRHAYAHNDANDYNILVRDHEIAGLIDFGDMVYTALINNVAVACTYAMLNQADPLQSATGLVKGYHSRYPLAEQELELLYYLIAARLCISVTQSAYNASQSSENEHHFITEKPAWDLLFKLIRINPVKARDAFKKACGFTPLPVDPGYPELINERKKRLGRNLSTSYKNKLKIIKGAFQYLYDDRGNTYVDCVNNPCHVGHCHPVVVKRMQQQIARLNTNTRYLHDHLVEYAKRITATLPPSLQVCYFTNSGSEANDLAIRMSRHYTKQKDVIVLDHAYHGTSTVAMEISPYKFDGKGGSGRLPYVHKALNPDLYRGVYKYGDAGAGPKYAEDVKRIIGELKKENKRPAVFICETLLGVGGQMPLPPGYLAGVYKWVREAGGVCIADEVQVGFGRVGEKFWGFELQEVVPDIVVMGKPIGNGHPLAAVIVTNEIADAFNNGMEYFNTFGGNPVSMVAGLAVLDVIQQEQMQQQARETGNYLMSGLKGLMNRFPLIGDVRGHGLFIGVEMVKDRTTLVPAVPEIDQVVEYLKEKGYLLSTDGPLHNVLKIKPPLTFNKQNADELIVHLEDALSRL